MHTAGMEGRVTRSPDWAAEAPVTKRLDATRVSVSQKQLLKGQLSVGRGRCSRSSKILKVGSELHLQGPAFRQASASV